MQARERDETLEFMFTSAFADDEVVLTPATPGIKRKGHRFVLNLDRPDQQAAIRIDEPTGATALDAQSSYEHNAWQPWIRLDHGVASPSFAGGKIEVDLSATTTSGTQAKATPIIIIRSPDKPDPFADDDDDDGNSR